MTGHAVVRAWTERFTGGQVRLAADFSFEATPVFLEYGPSALPVELRATPVGG